MIFAFKMMNFAAAADGSRGHNSNPHRPQTWQYDTSKSPPQRDFQGHRLTDCWEMDELCIKNEDLSIENDEFALNIAGVYSVCARLAVGVSSKFPGVYCKLQYKCQLFPELSIENAEMM